MELMDVLRQRRAVRAYSNARVERSTIESLISAAILAPSARNQQPWAFAATVDPARVADYSRRVKSWLLDQLASEAYDASIRHLLDDPAFNPFHGAPALVIVLATSAQSQAAEDCCLAAGHLMLAARDMELGTCWVGFARSWLDLTSTKAELQIPERYHVVAPIVLGTPKAWPTSHGRRPAEVHWLG